MKELIPWRKKGEGLMPSRMRDDSVKGLQRRMNDLFDDFFGDFESMFSSRYLPRRETAWLSETPCFEVSETDDEFLVKAELPGMDEKDIEISMEGDELVVRGEKKREHEEKHRNYHFSELSYGEFCRTVQLPPGVDRDKAKAQFKKGVLTLTLPKTEQVKTQRKKIEVAAE